MELLGDVVHVKSHFGQFGTALVSVQDRCMVCARCTIGSEIVLDAPDGTTSNEAQVEDHFGPLGDGANLDAR